MAGDWNERAAATGSTGIQTKPGTVTVAGKASVDLPPGTLNSMLKQAGVKKENQG